MVEAFAVASGKGGTGKTTSTLALGMALADSHDVTVVDADTGMANLLFHAGLSGADTTLHDVLAGGAPVKAATYERFGMRVVPCGTSLAGFREADPDRLRAAVADLAADADVLLLDSPAALGSKSAVLPVVLADRTVVEPTGGRGSLRPIAAGAAARRRPFRSGTETVTIAPCAVPRRYGCQRVHRVSELRRGVPRRTGPGRWEPRAPPRPGGRLSPLWPPRRTLLLLTADAISPRTGPRSRCE